MSYPSSLTALEEDFARAGAGVVTMLARSLVDGAKRFDLMKAQNLGVNWQYLAQTGMEGGKRPKIKRNLENPVSLTTEEAATATWAEPLGKALQEGERWNEGRRATASGVRYVVYYRPDYERYFSPEKFAALPEHDRTASAINPYMNTGMVGRGCLGSEGPNHAVDNGVITIKPDQDGILKLYALGILRKFDNDAPALAGGFAKFSKDESGAFLLDEESIVETKLEEFFEEMISGSIDLLPEYAERVPFEVAVEVQNRAMNVKNERGKKRMVGDAEIKKIVEETRAHLKFEQAHDRDPAFIQRLRDKIAAGKECFAGPVLNDDRNTNNSWMETRLSWFLMGDDVWQEIRGDAPVFDYRLAAGDDASAVVWHELNPKLIETAFASHGALFAFMASSFLLDRQEKGLEIPPSVIQQMSEIAQYLQKVTEPVLAQVNVPPSLSL